MVGRVGGNRVYFGDTHDVAELLPPEEEQTNNRGELRAALAALGPCARLQILTLPGFNICRGGCPGAGAEMEARHVDLWTQVLDLLDETGSEFQWLHVPSHIGIQGNKKADSLADDRRRRSPLLWGQRRMPPARWRYCTKNRQSVNPLPPHIQPHTPVRLDGPLEGTPRRSPASSPSGPGY